MKTVVASLFSSSVVALALLLSLPSETHALSRTECSSQYSALRGATQNLTATERAYYRALRLFERDLLRYERTILSYERKLEKLQLRLQFIEAQSPYGDYGSYDSFCYFRSSNRSATQQARLQGQIVALERNIDFLNAQQDAVLARRQTTLPQLEASYEAAQLKFSTDSAAYEACLALP